MQKPNSPFFLCGRIVLKFKNQIYSVTELKIRKDYATLDCESLQTKKRKQFKAIYAADLKACILAAIARELQTNQKQLIFIDFDALEWHSVSSGRALEYLV